LVEHERLAAERLEQQRLERKLEPEQWDQTLEPDPAWEQELDRQIAEHDRKRGRTIVG
jgi:hypothetical protein